MRRFLRTIRERLENTGPYSFKGVQLINQPRSLPRWPKESFSQKAEDLLIHKLLGESKGREVYEMVQGLGMVSQHGDGNDVEYEILNNP
jgi:hypothetical protein